MDVMKRIILALLLLVSLALTSTAAEFTGIKGRAALHGQTVEGVRVFVFRSVREWEDCAPFAVSDPTNLEGIYQVSLPPGKYWVVGYRGEGECPHPGPGDLFSFYGGNPVVVEKGKPTNVGLALTEVREDPAPTGKRGIEGLVVGEDGEPLQGAIVYFYRSPSSDFRGVPDYFTRTSKEGRFRARIGKGRYFIVVRKRQTGEVYGPTQVGDTFGFYARNPVEYDGKSSISVRVDCVVRLSQLERFEGFEPVKHGFEIRGRLEGPEGEGVPGYHVFAYRGTRRKGMPDAISGKSGKDGSFSLVVYEEGRYVLVARKRPGGPVEEGLTGEVTVTVPLSSEGVVIRLHEEGKR